MKYLILALALTSCTTVPKDNVSWSVVNQCLDDQVELYHDLCAEEAENGDDAHEEGVRCAIEYTKHCIDASTP